MENNLTLQANRKAFTKHCLAAALIELLKKNEYSEIRIQDVVDKAGFSRMGYYRNFKNIDEILDYYLFEVTDTFAKTSGIFVKDIGVEKFVAGIFKHLCSQEVKDLFLLLDKRGLQTHFYQQFALRFAEFDYKTDPYLYSFYGSGYFGVFYKWISTGCKETAEELTNIVLKIVTNINKE